MSKSKFLKSPLMIGAYACAATIAIFSAPVSGMPIAFGAISLLAFGRNSVASAAEVFSNHQTSSPSASYDADYTEYITEPEDTDSDDNASSPSISSRSLLTNSPTISPTSILRPYEVNNSASSGPHSLAYVLASLDTTTGGTLTFGAGAYNKSSKLLDTTYFSNIPALALDLTSALFTVDGDGIWLLNFYSPIFANLTFLSSYGSGSIFFINGGIAINSVLANNFMANIKSGAEVNLLNSYWYAGVNTSLTVNNGGSLILKDSRYDSITSTNSMFLNVKAGGKLELSSQGNIYCRNITKCKGTIEGTAVIDSGGYFVYSDVTIAKNGKFISGINGGTIYNSYLTFANNSTYQTIIGTGSQPLQVITAAGSTVNATLNLNDVTLDVLTDLSSIAVQGRSFTIISILRANVLGYCGKTKLNGADTTLYTVEYTPTKINVVFPAEPTFSPSKAPSKAPSLAPSKAPSLAPSALPSTEPSLLPSSAPTPHPKTLVNFTDMEIINCTVISTKLSGLLSSDVVIFPIIGPSDYMLCFTILTYNSSAALSAPHINPTTKSINDIIFIDHNGQKYGCKAQSTNSCKLGRKGYKTKTVNNTEGAYSIEAKVSLNCPDTTYRCQKIFNCTQNTGSRSLLSASDIQDSSPFHEEELQSEVTGAVNDIMV